MQISETPEGFAIAGDINRADLPALFAALTAGLLDLEAADIVAGATMAGLTAFIRRRLLVEGRPVVIRGAPQLLAHNLYRVGCLNHPQLTLIETRSEEAYG